jgi:hypothetical protein
VVGNTLFWQRRHDRRTDIPGYVGHFSGPVYQAGDREEVMGSNLDY